jgi:long-chain acyl-CoA synthetase
MRQHLATLLDDFRRYDREVAVVRYQGNRRRATTYGELARLAGRFAALLVQREIGPGDRVLLWAENRAEWIAAFFGCMLRGVLVVPLDANGTTEFAARVAADVKPKLTVGDQVLLDQLSGQFPRLAFEMWPAELPAHEAGAVAGLSPETPLQILFTSGTTGEPKGVVITHGNVLASVGPIEDGAQPYMRYERLIHPLRILHTLPLSHVFGQTMGLWVPSIFRAELYFENRPAAPRLIELIRHERISVLAAVPRMLALLKAHLESSDPNLAERVAAARGKIGPWQRWWRFRKVHRAFGLKFWAFVSGGGALPGSLEQFWNALGFVLIQGYGMTETTALITLNHPFHVSKGTIGKPLAGREVRLSPDGEVLVRGSMISAATWQGGAMHTRQEEWLATGDLAEKQPSGELRFLGRKSEVIVTASGLNVHPEDVEAAIEEQPGVAACAVVPMQTANGPEPCAVLACRGSDDRAAAAIAGANAHLAEFQRISRWVLWPEPDLPRTSTGKVLRKTVEAWLAKIQSAATTAAPGGMDGGAFGVSSDWLLTLITQITGETHIGVGDEQRLTEDLHLDSLGRVQLAAAIEERVGILAGSGSGLLEQIQTLGELRHLVAGDEEPWLRNESAPAPQNEFLAPSAWADEVTAPAAPSSTASRSTVSRSTGGPFTATQERNGAQENGGAAATARRRLIYPTWPWWKPVEWLRIGFVEAVMRPLVWLLADPRVTAAALPTASEPMLIVANHVSTYDGPLVEYALPAALRHRIAVAMSGEMLDDYRHFRNPEPLHPTGRFFLPGPLFYYLLTALFNVFPLPRLRDFQQSFTHAGRAMDRGFHVLVFPEGTRSAAGKLAHFRPGIGLLARQCNAPVLPIALRGLGELKAGKRRWFRSGAIEVCIGQPIRFSPAESETAITTRLHAEIERLLQATSTRETA